MKKTKTLLTLFTWTTCLFVGGSIAVITAMYLYLSPQLPEVDSLRTVKFQTPLRVYSADHRLIAEFGEKRSTPINYEEIPQGYINAILAAEDDQFYEHSGVSIKGLMRATSQLITTGAIQSGGSTITMQVARNFFLSRRQTFARKFNEIFLALKIERELTKEQILELYVNVIFLGNRAYGIQAAAHVYYGKPLNELSLAQLAMIAGLPKAPSIFNPIVNPSRALTRRNWILGRMKQLEFISEEEYQQAVNELVTAKYHGTQTELSAAYIAEMARKSAVDKYGLDAYTEGYRIYTTVNSRYQAAAQRAVTNGLITYDERHGFRGPEHNFYSQSTEAPTPEQLDTAIQLADWTEQLKDYPTYGGLQAAAVIEVLEKDISILFANGETATVFWDNGLSKARRYINEDSRGPSPKQAGDVVNLGDVIRVQEAESGWKFSQIPAAQAALVSLSPDNGAILALVGGFDFKHSHFNRATQAERQPGSNFKPFIYTAALENGMSAATTINDAPIVFDDSQLESTWRPQNDGGKFGGPTRLRKALYQSRNLVSIRALRSIGINNAIKTLEKFGFSGSELPKDLSLALGSHAITPIRIAEGYASFANGGYKVSPYLIDRIEDTDGNTIYRAFPDTVCYDCDSVEQEPEISEDSFFDTPEPLAPSFDLPTEAKAFADALTPADYPRAEKILDNGVAYIIDDMMRDVVQRGTGRKAKTLKRNDLAGKTGTTNGPTDAWFSGYQKEVVTTTWVGFDQNHPLGRREYGGSAALPIWIDYMGVALENKAIYTPDQPEGVIMVRIDPENGKRARAGDPDAVFEIFRESNAPAQEEQKLEDPWSSEDSLQEELY